MFGEVPSNTQEFRCFQTSQETRMMREFSPFLISIGTLLMADFHLPEKFEAVGEGATTTRFNCRRKSGNIILSF
jgi:hypothetical protein